MKKSHLILAFLMLSAISIKAQSPEKMSYQAIVRNTNGTLVVNKTIGIKISIQKWVFAIPKPFYSSVYAETHSPTTNENGLINIAIGTGSVIAGSVKFSDIDWASETYYMRTDIDILGGTAYTITNITQLLSVPYALHSKTADNARIAVKATIADTAKFIQLDSKTIKMKIFKFNSGYRVPLLITPTEMGITTDDMRKFQVLSMEVGWGPVAASSAHEFRGNKEGITYEICAFQSDFRGVKIYFPDKQEYHDREGRIIYVLVD